MVVASPGTFELIRELEERIIDPAMRRSPQALAELLADDFLEFTASGGVYGKEAIIALLAADSGPEWSELTNYDYELRTLAEGVLFLTYRHRGRREGGAETHSLRSSIWKLTDGRWRLVFHQGTPTNPEA